MRILNRRQLETWDLRWPAIEPGPWLLTSAEVDAVLGTRPSAIGVYWIGSSPMGTHLTFRAKYCGKAVDQPLRTRLKQHASGRGNPHVAQHLRNKSSKKGSGTKSRNGPSGASHFWFLTPFSDPLFRT